MPGRGKRTTFEDLFRVLTELVEDSYPGDSAEVLELRLRSGRTISLPVPAPGGGGRQEEGEGDVWIPTATQQTILDALEGRGLRTDDLAHAVGSRSQLYRRPGGLPELQDRGIVKHHPKVGFYRPDAPPEVLIEKGG
jgi:hypothetical protein